MSAGLNGCAEAASNALSMAFVARCSWLCRVYGAGAMAGCMAGRVEDNECCCGKGADTVTSFAVLVFSGAGVGVIGAGCATGRCGASLGGNSSSEVAKAIRSG